MVSDSPVVFGSPVLPKLRCPFSLFQAQTYGPFPGAEVEAGGGQDPAPWTFPMWGAVSHPVLGNLGGWWSLESVTHLGFIPVLKINHLANFLAFNATSSYSNWML